ncbi:MAG: formylmethanofuran dehydrogenase subunit B [Candidatus Bathyarchaeia archaeon]|nr:formylmethanofuran dehydrogenase subunit B [Candidatus Bathyarchaeota archaeon]
MQTIYGVVCPFCGCCCDDIEIIVEDNQIYDVRNACSLGASKFMEYHRNRNTRPLIRRDGKLVETSLDEAIERAADILAGASYPLLYGWSNTSCEAVRVGLEIAEEVGGIIDNTTTVCHGPSILAIQEVGLPACTLGQIRHRADLIIYWGSNPWSAHPRHIERYTALAEGRFQRAAWKRYLSKLILETARKKRYRAASLAFKSEVAERLLKEEEEERWFLPPPEERKLVVVDVRKTRSADLADIFIKVRPNEDYEVLQALRALIRDEDLDVDEVAGVPVEDLEKLADLMVNARFGILFFGLGLTMSEGRSRNIEAAIKLTRDLNKYTKFLIMPMRGHFNVTGANVVFTWQTGYPYAVDFSHGYPRYNPGETSAVDVLYRGDVDATLVIASDPVSSFPRKAVENLVRRPLIVIDPCLSSTALMADVVIPSAFVGIEAEGTTYRMDHVPLPLKKVVEPPPGVLPDEEILRRILHRVRERKGKAS